MGALIVLSIIALVFIASAAVAVFGDKGKHETRFGDTHYGAGVYGILVAVVSGVLFGVVWAVCSFSSVPARSVGIEVEFGKATDHLTPGLNWVAPWSSVEIMPTTSQPLDLDATDNTDASKANPVGVKFKGGGSGSVNVNMNYHIAKDEDAIKLWNQWKDFEAVKEKVVNQKAQSTVAQLYGALLPEEATDGTKIAQMNNDIKTSLNEALSTDGIVVENVSVKKVDLDPAIQDRINKQVSALADQNKAKIDRDTANIIAEKNRILQSSTTGQTLADKCLDVVNNWNVQKNGPLPAGFSCVGAGSLPLTVPTK